MHDYCLLQLTLHSKHKYKLKIVIEDAVGYGKIVIPLENSSFITVTAYKSIQLTKHKIAGRKYDRMQAEEALQNEATTPEPPIIEAGKEEELEEPEASCTEVAL